MKIKTICEVTGLTDRTIRYYIEEQLISPAYTENYLGRKSFDFSQEDMDALKHISVLRRFDFTIQEIRQIIEDAGSSGSIISDVLHRTEENVALGQEKLLALSGLSSERVYTLEQLAQELSRPAVELPEKKERIRVEPVKMMLSLAKSLTILLIVWLPPVLSLLALISGISEYKYPNYDGRCIVLVILSLWPCAAVPMVSKSNLKRKQRIKRILLILCVLSIPVSSLLSMWIITGSETTDIRNYRRLDAECLANRDSFFQDLFPTWPHYFVNRELPDGSWGTVYLDARYHYSMRPGFDQTYDVYAQWPLEKEKFDKEVARAKALFEARGEEYLMTYEVVETENYTCLISYAEEEPFEEVNYSYTYYIFAYDEENMVVRYILCYSLEDGYYQPYYLTLEW